MADMIEKSEVAIFVDVENITEGYENINLIKKLSFLDPILDDCKDEIYCFYKKNQSKNKINPGLFQRELINLIFYVI